MRTEGLGKVSSAPSSLLHILTDEQLYHEDQHAGGHGHAEEAESAPGEQDGGGEGGEAGDLGAGGVHHGREGHDGEGDIGHIIEEGTQGDVLYLFADERERKDADEVGDHCHDGDIDIGITHGRPPLPQASLRFLPSCRARGRARRQWPI